VVLWTADDNRAEEEAGMNRVMIVAHRKMDPVVYDVSSDALLKATALTVFRFFNDEWLFYAELENTPAQAAEQEDRVVTEGDATSEQPPAYRDADKTLLAQQLEWYNAAKNGDAAAALKLLEYRKERAYEYEDEWRIADVQTVALPRKAARPRTSTRKAKETRSPRRAASRTKKQARRR